MAEADAENRLTAVDQFANLWNYVFARRRRVAWPVGKEYAIGIAREDCVGRSISWYHRHSAVQGRKVT